MHHPDVYLGSIQPYEGGRPSAIAKRLVEGTLKLTPLGLAGDEQAEKATMAGLTAPFATTRASITTTGVNSSPLKQNSSARPPLVRIFLLSA